MKKSALLELLETMPDSLDLDKLMYTLHVRQKIEQAIEEAEDGDFIPQEELEEEVRSWFA